MSDYDFRLKQFGIKQGRTAMKVGTDAIALASWLVSLSPQADSILDLGAGTGILSLMLAQHYSKAKITAIEIERGAYDDMCENFASSPWSDRLMAIHADALEYKSQEGYDLIISNPPFYAMQTLRAEDESRQLARTERIDGLGVSSLIEKAKTLLRPSGTLAMICPIEREEDLRRSACESLMYLDELCTLYSLPHVAVRLLVCLKPLLNTSSYHISHRRDLVQRESTGAYTTQYKRLTEPYLLH